MPQFNNTLRMFQPRLMTNDQNFEMLMSSVAESDTSIRVVGNFRYQADYGGLTWESEDKLSHPKFRRPTRNDYSGLTLEYDYRNVENCINLKDKLGMVMTVKYTDDTVEYVRLHNYDINRPLEDWEEGSGTKFPKTRVPGTTDGNSGHIVLDFDNLYAGWAPYELAQVTETIYEWVDVNDEERWATIHALGYPFNEGLPSHQWTKIDTTRIKSLMWGFTPKEYTTKNPKPLGESRRFEYLFDNWRVTSGDDFLCELPPMNDTHQFFLADDYDDNYNITPQWLLEQMYRLGFRRKINFYIGASHFYDKTALVVNGSFVDTPNDYCKHKYIMLLDRPFNDGFRQWYYNYLKYAKTLGFDHIVQSISMENVDAPSDWYQRAWDGTPGSTLWTPTPYLLSFTNGGLQEFYKMYTRGLCELAVDLDIQPIIQFGEFWWWWIESRPDQPPCFYDESTKRLHKRELGYDIPIFKTAKDVNYVDHMETLVWLRQQNGKLSHMIRDYLREEFPSHGVKVTVLFFPPSVLDSDRVPPMMHIVNFPKEEWKRTSPGEQLSFFQIEDYDWVIAGEFNKVHKTLLFPGSYLGYPKWEVEYFAGFANTYEDYLNWWQGTYMPEGLTKEEYLELVWSRINKSAVLGVSNELDTYIWASAQIRRDGWEPPEVYYTSERL